MECIIDQVRTTETKTTTTTMTRFVPRVCRFQDVMSFRFLFDFFFFFQSYCVVRWNRSSLVRGTDVSRMDRDKNESNTWIIIFFFWRISLYFGILFGNIYIQNGALLIPGSIVVGRMVVGFYFLDLISIGFHIKGTGMTMSVFLWSADACCRNNVKKKDRWISDGDFSGRLVGCLVIGWRQWNR